MAYVWARPSIVSLSVTRVQAPLLGTVPSGKSWLRLVGARIEAGGSRWWSSVVRRRGDADGFYSHYGNLVLNLGADNRITVRASHVNDAASGSIDTRLMQSMADKIKDHLKAESVDVKDAYGDGRHVSIDVVASSFEGQSAVNRQRMVYKAIWEELQSTVHAVDQMTTRTPAEAATDK